MEIGKPRKTIHIEPLRVPIPERRPVESPPEPAPERVEVPA